MNLALFCLLRSFYFSFAPLTLFLLVALFSLVTLFYLFFAEFGAVLSFDALVTLCIVSLALLSLLAPFLLLGFPFVLVGCCPLFTILHHHFYHTSIGGLTA